MKSLLILFALALTHPLQAADNMKAFPPADEGMQRYVINLPEQPDETQYKVQLIIGKTVTTDTENQYFFGGQIKAENIEGWGFTKYVVKKIGPMAGTLMAVPPESEKVDRFISLGGEPYLIRYNSRLPIVVYVPEDFEVRYQIWTTQGDPIPAKLE